MRTRATSLSLRRHTNGTSVVVGTGPGGSENARVDARLSSAAAPLLLPGGLAGSAQVTERPFTMHLTCTSQHTLIQTRPTPTELHLRCEANTTHAPTDTLSTSAELILLLILLQLLLLFLLPPSPRPPPPSPPSSFPTTSSFSSSSFLLLWILLLLLLHHHLPPPAPPDAPVWG